MLIRVPNTRNFLYGIVALLCLMLSACATRPGSPVTVSGKVIADNAAAKKQSLNNTEQAALRAVTAFKNFLSQHNIKRGAIAISYNGELLASHGVNRLVTEAVPVASLSKAITAVCATHALAAAGKSLDTTLAELFPAFFLERPYADENFKNITVQQLASHTSGIRAESVINLAYRGKNIRKEHNEWIFRQVAAQPLVSVPGTKFNYDNASYAILGLIISTLTNEPYNQYCNNNILKTAGVESAEMYKQWLIKSSFGGWKVSAIDYLKFIDTYYRDPRGIGRKRFTNRYGHNYGLGTAYRKGKIGYNYWHHGSFLWISNVRNVSYGSFFAVFGNGYSVVVNFSRDGGEGRREALDTALYNAFY